VLIRKFENLFKYFRKINALKECLLGEGLFVGAGIVLSEKYLNGGNQIISQRDL